MAKAKRLPDGYDDEATFLQEARERFQQGVDFDRLNRDAGMDDLRFLAGDQWDDYAKLARANRPMLTVNRLPQFVAQVVGDIRINRPSIKVRPAEDADKDLADIREGLIRGIERQNDAQGVYAAAGENQVACGIGNFAVSLKYANDDGFDRDIAIENIPNPFAVVWDPLSTERTGRDAEWCFVGDMVPRKAFLKQWKDELPSDLEVPQTDVGGWYTGDEVRITSYWLMCEQPAIYARLQNGSTVEVVEEGEGYALAKRKGGQVTPKPLPWPIATDDDGVLMVRKGRRRYACLYVITGTAILAGPYEFPIDRVPVFRARGWEVNVGDKRVRFGLVRFAKDPQRLLNYWRSINAEMLALAPKGKWLLHESQEGGQDAFRDAVQSDDPILSWSGSTAPAYVPPPALNSAVLQEVQMNAQDMKDVTGLHDASLGAKSNETSGKAIEARQREGDVANYIYPDNLKAAIGECGRVVDQLIPTVFDTARTVRIVGEDEATKVQRINDPNDPQSIDINRGKYDVVIETGPSYSTKRVEAAESMLAFFQANPAAAQVAGDLFAKAQDWPTADELAERLKRALPPQITQSDDEDLTPEQQQEKAAQAQQAQQAQAMQQQAAHLQLEETAAKTEKAKADAKKARADALKAEAEAVQTQLEMATGETAKVMEVVFGPGAAEHFLQAFEQYMAGKAAANDVPGPEGGQEAA